MHEECAISAQDAGISLDVLEACTEGALGCSSVWDPGIAFPRAVRIYESATLGMHSQPAQRVIMHENPKGTPDDFLPMLTLQSPLISIHSSSPQGARVSNEGTGMWRS